MTWRRINYNNFRKREQIVCKYSWQKKVVKKFTKIEKNFVSKVLIQNTLLNMATKGGSKLGPLLKILEESKEYWILQNDQQDATV